MSGAFGSSKVWSNRTGGRRSRESDGENGLGGVLEDVLRRAPEEVGRLATGFARDHDEVHVGLGGGVEHHASGMAGLHRRREPVRRGVGQIDALGRDLPGGVHEPLARRGDRVVGAARSRAAGGLGVEHVQRVNPCAVALGDRDRVLDGVQRVVAAVDRDEHGRHVECGVVWRVGRAIRTPFAVGSGVHTPMSRARPKNAPLGPAV